MEQANKHKRMQEQNEEEMRQQGNFPHLSARMSELERLRQPLGGTVGSQ